MSFHKLKNCRRGEELSFLANDSKIFFAKLFKKAGGSKNCNLTLNKGGRSKVSISNLSFWCYFICSVFLINSHAFTSISENY